MTSSEATTSAPASPTADQAPPVRWPVAAVGGLIAALGLSGLIDDSGLIEHPWWVAPVATALAAAIAMMLGTVRSLAAPSTPTPS